MKSVIRKVPIESLREVLTSLRTINYSETSLKSLFYPSIYKP